MGIRSVAGGVSKAQVEAMIAEGGGGGGGGNLAAVYVNTHGLSSPLTVLYWSFLVPTVWPGGSPAGGACFGQISLAPGGFFYGENTITIPAISGAELSFSYYVTIRDAVTGAIMWFGSDRLVADSDTGFTPHTETFPLPGIAVSNGAYTDEDFSLDGFGRITTAAGGIFNCFVTMNLSD